MSLNLQSDIVALMEKAVVSAASHLVKTISSGVNPQVWVKEDHTLVMTLDYESQERILSILGKDHAIVAEEDQNSHSLIDSAASYFTVDPLDGTTSCRRYMNEEGGQIGFGPLIGYVDSGVLTAASFYSVPHKKLFTAVLNHGVYACRPDLESGVLPPIAERKRLAVKECETLSRAGLLFFVGLSGEIEVVYHLKKRHAVENLYRFGGFANDCSRLAQGFEQLTVQFSVKPWDYAAALFPHEAGLEVILDPFESKKSLRNWKMRMNNPLIIVQKSIKDELFDTLKDFKA